MTHIYLIRHGDSVEVYEDGKTQDKGLSPEGISQTEKLRDRLARTGEIKADVLISSTMRRAHETAQILAPALNLPVTLDADFEEWRGDDGSLDPQEFMKQWEQVPPAQKAYFRWMDGYENRLEFSLRVHLALNRVIQAHADQTIAIVSHGAFIQTAFMYFFGYGEAALDRAVPDIRRTSITHWFRSGTRWILERSNDYAHLSG